jgi:cation:H+ antiporter
MLLAGLALAGFGGEIFVRGLVGIAQWVRIPSGIVAVTLAAFATSSPELSVSVNAALDGTPQIGFGDAVGSNVVNIGLVLGLALAIGAIKAPRGSVRRDFPVAILVPFLTALLLIDGELSRIDGVVMIGLFCVWLGVVLVEAWRQRSAAKAVLGERRHWLAAVLSAVGFIVLVIAGRLVVTGASEIGSYIGLDPFIIGATIVAIGTSIPELATTVISRWRGHEEVGLGTVLGSNIFNGFFIAAVAAVIHPIVIAWQEVAIGLGFGALTVAMIYPGRDGIIGRRRGVMLLAIYAVYVVAILQAGP